MLAFSLSYGHPGIIIRMSVDSSTRLMLRRVFCLADSDSGLIPMR